MKIRDNKIILYIFPLLIFIFALFIRFYFFQGFVLCDDPSEVGLVENIKYYLPTFNDQLVIRFGVWIFNSIFLRLLGMSEFSFFLPTVLMSASFGIIAYFLLIFWKYPRDHSFLAGLFISSAPFEVLIGTLRANDLIFSWLMALAFFSFIRFEKKPILQGILLAFFLWFGFYIKAWVIFFFPVLGIYYLVQILKCKKLKGFESFLIFSIILHGITSIFWKIRTNTFIPWLYLHPATYPAPKQQLFSLFQVYPKMVFVGSEFGTTLFGYVPYLLILLLVAKIILSKSKRFSKSLRIDKPDIYLFAIYTSFFLLLNFFPDTYKFDQLYYAPRIFRYLTPISFPITLHLAKLVIDFGNVAFKFNRSFKRYGPILLFAVMIAANIYQVDNATKPGRIYRQALLSIVRDVKGQSPPQIVSESWLGFFLREVYLKGWENKVVIPPNYTIDDAKKYEDWLEKIEHGSPNGTILITGLSSCVHYGCHNCGFRLKQFRHDLDYDWQLFREYDMLTYLPIPEPARLWILNNRTDARITLKIF